MNLIASPFDKKRLGDFLLSGLKSEAIRFDAASAFARLSGVNYVAGPLEAFSKTRPTRLIVGVDLLGTSVEALEELLRCSGKKAETFVFHNPATTFHPKVFRFEYSDRWEVYCGSGNLTRGGLFENYEMGAVLSLRRADPLDRAINDHIEEEFRRWSDLTTSTVERLSKALIRQLANDKLILRERALKRVVGVIRRAAGQPKGARHSPFGTATTPSAPALPVASSRQTRAFTTFVMTLEPADAAPTPGRSPEFFIPKRARDMRPKFWGWPQLYVAKGAAMNRYNTPFRFRGANEPSTLFGYADRAEFRLRNTHMRAAANVGDILRIRHDEANPHSPYHVDILAKGTRAHAIEFGRCTERATASPRRYGYY
jgi:HKD family nuclease